MKIYVDLHRWWIGYEFDDTHHHVCIVPVVVIRWPRRLKRHVRR